MIINFRSIHTENGLHPSNDLKCYPYFSLLPARFCFDLLETHRTRPERSIKYTHLKKERSKNLWECPNLNGGKNLWVFHVIWILWLSWICGDAKSPSVSDWSNCLCQCLVVGISSMFTERQVNGKEKFKNQAVPQTPTKDKYKRRKEGKPTQILATKKIKSKWDKTARTKDKLKRQRQNTSSINKDRTHLCQGHLTQRDLSGSTSMSPRWRGPPAWGHLLLVAAFDYILSYYHITYRVVYAKLSRQ